MGAMAFNESAALSGLRRSSVDADFDDFSQANYQSPEFSRLAACPRAFGGMP
jgi:hypothetical protein